MSFRFRRSRLAALIAAGAIAPVLAPAAHAQTANSCPGGAATSPDQIRQDACQKALDLFAFMAPQLGASITGGNTILGSGGALGGLGHFSVGLRANVIRGQLPQTDGVTLGIQGRQASDFAPKSQVLGLPSAEAAVGLFKGIPLGLTNILGVDVLLSAFYVPDVEEDGFSLSTTDGSLKLGYGARIGILQETAIVPGVSVSVLRRDLPTANLTARVGTADSVRVEDFEATTTSWRLVASKRFMLVGVSAGAGQDRYDASASASAYVAPRAITVAGIPLSVGYDGPVATASQEMTRTNVFGGLSLNLPFVRFAGEVGRVSGGSVPATFNTFGDRRPDDAYTYGSVGVRVQF